MGYFSDLAYRMGLRSMADLLGRGEPAAERAARQRWTRGGRRSLTALHVCTPVPNARFPLGTVRATADALDALRAAGVDACSLVRRHARGDWGDLSPEEWARNDLGLTRAWRLLSQYRLSTGAEVWVFTEVDETLTLLLTEQEYWEAM